MILSSELEEEMNVNVYTCTQMPLIRLVSVSEYDDIQHHTVSYHSLPEHISISIH